MKCQEEILEILIGRVDTEVNQEVSVLVASLP